MNEYKKYGLSFVEMETLDKDAAFIVSKELIQELFCNMAKLCTKYSNNLFYDLPYSYTERRLDSVLLPALSKICDSMVTTEAPTYRHFHSSNKFVGSDSYGRIDYWCIYKGYSFVIELKQSFDCFLSDNTRARLRKSWKKMNEQLFTIENDVRQYTELTKGVIRIGLHIITSYSDKEPSKVLIDKYKEKISSIIERLPSQVIKIDGKNFPSLKPNILIGWVIPDKIVLDERAWETIPGIWAMAKVLPPIQHTGFKNQC